MSYQFLNNINSINNLTQVFTTDGLSTNNSNNTGELMVWNKPKGVRLISIICGGGGGGGGKGGYFAGYGGNGGGGGEIAHGLFLAQFVPDILYIKVGFGGRGETLDGFSYSGGPSFVSVSPNNLVSDNMLIVGSGGGAAIRSNPNSGGSGGNSTNIINNDLKRFSVYYRNSATGNRGVTIPTETLNRTFCFGAGGAGGGAVSTASSIAVSGGSSFLPTESPSNTYIPHISLNGFSNLGGASGGGNATSSIPRTFGSLLMTESLDCKTISPYTFCYVTAGSGGGGILTGNGGHGGNGGPTCGGGGAGGTGDNALSPAANGGNGGPGFVIISCSY